MATKNDQKDPERLQLWVVLGLQIHQRKGKCGGSNQMHACTAAAGQIKRNHCQVERHSATDPTSAAGERKTGLLKRICIGSSTAWVSLWNTKQEPHESNSTDCIKKFNSIILRMISCLLPNNYSDTRCFLGDRFPTCSASHNNSMFLSSFHSSLWDHGWQMVKVRSQSCQQLPGPVGPQGWRHHTVKGGVKNNNMSKESWLHQWTHTPGDWIVNQFWITDNTTEGSSFRFLKLRTRDGYKTSAVNQ